MNHFAIDFENPRGDFAPMRAFRIMLATLATAFMPLSHADAEVIAAATPAITLQAKGPSRPIVACPPGKSYALFCQVFRLDSIGSRALFRQVEFVRTRHLGTTRFLGPDLLAFLTRLARSHGKIVGGAGTCAYFSSTLSRALLAPSGDGVAIHLTPTSQGFYTRVCSLADSLPTGDPWLGWLRNGQVLLVKVQLDGDPHVMLFHAPRVDDENRAAAQQEFFAGVSRVATSHHSVVLPSEPKREVLGALRVPIVHQGQ